MALGLLSDLLAGFKGASDYGGGPGGFGKAFGHEFMNNLRTGFGGKALDDPTSLAPVTITPQIGTPPAASPSGGSGLGRMNIGSLLQMLGGFGS